MEGKKPRRQAIQTFAPITIYISKGFEAFWSAPDEVTIVGPDLNSLIRLHPFPDGTIDHLEEDAIKVVDGLAAPEL
jgi:hypothetical protein